jgi:NitT/TauT family transport system permease protein
MRGRYLTQAVALLALALVWEVVARALAVDWLPPFSGVVARTGKLLGDGTLPEALLSSVPGLLAGYGISVVLGVPLGLAMGTFYTVRCAASPYVNALLMSPAIAMAPVFFAIFGLSEWSIVAVIVVFTMPFIVVNTLSGVEQVDPDLLTMVRSFGAGHLQMFTNVTVRAAAPLVLAGLRLGLTRAIKGMIAGQLILAVFGLGRLANEFAGTFDATGAMSVALATIVVSVIAVGLLQVLEARVDARSR